MNDLNGTREVNPPNAMRHACSLPPIDLPPAPPYISGHITVIAMRGDMFDGRFHKFAPMPGNVTRTDARAQPATDAHERNRRT